MELTGVLQIMDWQETVENSFGEEIKLSVALVQQIYSGDIVGASNVRYQLFYDKSGNAQFNGFETITYDCNGEQARLTLKHDGAFLNGTASSKFIVIGSTHDTELNGKLGSFTSIEGGKATYEIS